VTTGPPQHHRNTGANRDRLVLAIDPGARYVGAVTRLRRAGTALADDQLVGRLVLDVCGDARALTRDNVRRVARRLDDDLLLPALRECGRRALTVDVLVALEGLRPPTGFADGKRAALDPRGPMATALVLGALLGHSWPVPDEDLVLVPPGHNGAGALRTYPPALIGPAEARRGLDRPAGQSNPLRHARSAWDVAGVALRTTPLGQRPAPALP
jgi:hypothetical protein